MNHLKPFNVAHGGLALKYFRSSFCPRYLAYFKQILNKFELIRSREKVLQVKNSPFFLRYIPSSVFRGRNSSSAQVIRIQWNQWLQTQSFSSKSHERDIGNKKTRRKGNRDWRSCCTPFGDWLNLVIIEWKRNGIAWNVCKASAVCISDVVSVRLSVGLSVCL